MILTVQNLSFSYANQAIFEDLSLDVPEGTIYGLLGLNGQGKSTLIKLITGLYESSGGSIELFGVSLIPKNRDSILQKLGVLIEQSPLYENMTAFENLKIIQIARKLPQQSIEDILEKVNLSKSIHAKVETFSMGMKQRLGIALALIASPKFIILDEPTNGLDPLGVEEFREMVLKLNQEMGITFLISTHIIAELEQYATDFCILHGGKIVASGKVKDLQNSIQSSNTSLKDFFIAKVS